MEIKPLLPINEIFQQLYALPKEIQDYIMEYAGGNKNEIWYHTKTDENPTTVAEPHQQRAHNCNQCTQYSALEYIKPKSFITKIINEEDFLKKNNTSNNTIKIHAAQCHPKLNFLAISTNKAYDGLHIFEKENQQPLAILKSTGNRIAFHPTKPILASTSGRKINIFDFAKAKNDENALNFPNSYPDCTIASFEIPDRKYNSANHIKSIVFYPTQTSTSLEVTSGAIIKTNDARIDTWTSYGHLTPDQLMVKNAIINTLRVERPNKEITSIDQLLDTAALLCGFSFLALNNAWETLPTKVQDVLWKNAQQFIQEHGKIFSKKEIQDDLAITEPTSWDFAKQLMQGYANDCISMPSKTDENNDVPEITENELALIMGGCTIQ